MFFYKKFILLCTKNKDLIKVSTIVIFSFNKTLYSFAITCRKTHICMNAAHMPCCKCI